MKSKKLIYTVLFIWRTLLLDIMVLTGDVNKRNLLFEDLQRINGLPFPKHRYLNLNYALLTQKMFRAVFYYRYRKDIISTICKIFIPNKDDIEIRCVSGQIGGGYSVIPQFWTCN